LRTATNTCTRNVAPLLLILKLACRTVSELSDLKIKHRNLLASAPSNTELADKDYEIQRLNTELDVRLREIERLTKRVSGRHERVLYR